MKIAREGAMRGGCSLGPTTRIERSRKGKSNGNGKFYGKGWGSMMIQGSVHDEVKGIVCI
jgi:hypothetical protein